MTFADYLTLCDLLPSLKGNQRKAALTVLDYGLRSMRYGLSLVKDHREQGEDPPPAKTIR